MRRWFLFGLVAVPAMWWLAGCANLSSRRQSKTLIEYRRSGGFIGLRDWLVIKENGETVLVRRSSRFEFTLDRETVTRLRELCEAAGFARLRDEYLPPGSGADLLEHVVTYRGRTVRAVDGAVPAELQPVLEALNKIIESKISESRGP